MSYLKKISIVWVGLALTLFGCSRETPTVEFTSTAQTVQEAEGTASVEVSLSKEAALAVRVPYTLSGTASGGGTPSDDYTGSDGVLTIPIGQKSASIDFPLITHGAPLPDRTLVVTLGTPENGILGTSDVQTVTISNVGGSPSSVNASFPWSGTTSPDSCVGTDVVPIPLFLDMGQTAPSNLTFPLNINAVGFVPGDFTVSFNNAPTPGLAFGSPSVSGLVVPSGANSIFALIEVDCTTINNGDTIELVVSAPSGHTVGPNSSVTVTFQ